MPGFRARRARPDASHECDYRDAVARVRIELEQIQAMHGKNTMVNSTLVLDLLSPRGMWRFTGNSTEPQVEEQDEDTDPLTGCKPVTAKKPAG